MSRNAIIITVCLIVLSLITATALGLWYLSWNKKMQALKALQGSGGVVDQALENATKGALPEINTNPLEDKPNLNPAEAGNPIKNVKTNPFE